MDQKKSDRLYDNLEKSYGLLTHVKLIKPNRIHKVIIEFVLPPIFIQSKPLFLRGYRSVMSAI